MKAHFDLVVNEYYEIFYWEIFSTHYSINLRLGYHDEHDHRYHRHPPKYNPVVRPSGVCEYG